MTIVLAVASTVVTCVLILLVLGYVENRRNHKLVEGYTERIREIHDAIQLQFFQPRPLPETWGEMVREEQTEQWLSRYVADEMRGVYRASMRHMDELIARDKERERAAKEAN